VPSQSRAEIAVRPRGASVAILAALACVMIHGAAAQEIGRLYVSRPPPGSAFVRIAATTGLAPNTKMLVNTTPSALEGSDTASRYVAVVANRPVSILVGKTPTETSLVPLPGKFYTIAIEQAGQTLAAKVIDEGSGDSNDLKAQLRFFNLTPDCKAVLRIAEGPAVFDGTDFGDFKSRAINPVQAKLQADCNAGTAQIELPQLKSGDHYSLFLRKLNGTMVLSGQFDETEPYREQ